VTPSTPRWRVTSIGFGEGSNQVVQHLEKDMGEKKMQDNDIRLFATVRAFVDTKISRNEFRVSPDGTVRVWNSIAGGFTLCPDMSKSSVARVRRMAEVIRANRS
jgi:hypothetical protein